MSGWQVSVTAIQTVCIHCEPHTRGDILADNSKVIASHQDILKLPCAQIIKLSGYSVRCLARNRSGSVAVSNVCSSKQHVSQSPKSPRVPRHLSGWRQSLPHTDVPVQGHDKVNIGAFQFRPSENQRPPDHSSCSSLY
jgi:hypothetical protein